MNRPGQSLQAVQQGRRRSVEEFVVDAINALVAGGASIEVLYVHGHWRGVNDLDDLRRAVDFAHGQAQLGAEPGAGPASPPND